MIGHAVAQRPSRRGPQERPMRSAAFALVLVLTLGRPSSATQEVAPPDVRGFPATPAPDALGTAPLPDTASAVGALFERLPADVAGHARVPQFARIAVERASAGYGEDPRITGVRTPRLWLQAIDVSKEGFFPPNWTAGQVVAFMAGQTKEAKEAGRDGDLLWARQETFRDAVSSSLRFSFYGTPWC